MKIDEKTVRDRDYLLDIQGNYLRVIGDLQEDNSIYSFVKYHPIENGKRVINGKSYQYNNFIYKSLEYLNKYLDRVALSKHYGRTVTITPVSQVSEFFSCREKTKYVITNKEKYSGHPIGKHLVKFIELAGDYINLDDLGITGSFLIGAESVKSDIDLVCYGEEAYEGLYRLFKTNSFIQCYEDGLEDIIYKRRIEHLTPTAFKSIIIQESRKLQGVIRGTDIHINCQPLRADDNIPSIEILEIGEVACIVEITDDAQGHYSPAVYTVRYVKNTDCSFYSEDSLKDIEALVSLDGTYSQCYRNGDRISVYGKLIILKLNDKTMKAIELSSWNTAANYKAEFIMTEDEE